MGRLLSAAAALLLAARAAPAEPPRDLLPAFLELRVNGVRGETSLVHLEGEDVWAAVHDLSRAGLSFSGTRREIDGRSAVSLRSLAPDLRFEVDEPALLLRIVAGPALLGRRELDLSATRRPAALETATVTSAFLNYTARATTREEASGTLEGGLSVGTALLHGSVSAARGDVVRGLTSLWVDDPRRLVRFVAGDAVTLPDALGGAPLVTGISFVRELSLDPYLVREPLPGSTAFATTPSVLEVYVNGALARTQAVAPGTYDLSRLPVTTGASDIRVLVRDSFGRTQEVEAAHYQAQGLLARGLHDWGWHVGAVRRAFGVESFSFGDPLLLLRHRAGVTERLTLGYRLDLGPTVHQASLSATAGLPVGQLDLSVAASDEDGERGGAALVAWRYGSRRLTLGADATLRSRSYATSTLRAGDDRALWRASVRATVPLGSGVGLTLQWSGSRLRDQGTTQRLEARTSLSIAPRTWLVLSASADREGTGDPYGTAFVQVVVAAPGRTTADAGGRIGRAGEKGGTVGAQRSLPPGPGLGWRIRGDTAGEGTVSGLVQAQPWFGRYEAAYDRSYGSEVGTLSAAGGVVLVGGGIFATRPVEQSFALVRVPGVPGVRVRLEQQHVGRTTANGDLLVPGLLPYYGNRVSIADTDVPADFQIGRVERVVAPPPRGAALVKFEVEPLRALEGRVLLVGPPGGLVPAYGTLEVDTPRGPRRSPIAAGGEFWLEDVPPGSHAARIYLEGNVCEFALSIPETGPGVVELGTLGCGPKRP